ncbi:MAG: VWA domain-containing protein, partial [Planctomycetota bacterium]|nr:VWA domain-containing protein [Planctomycetota bacterium]
ANLILQMSLPAAARDLPELGAKHFAVYIFPASLPLAEGAAERWQARGLIFWRHGESAFLDVRKLPALDRAGSYTVMVRCLADGALIAAGQIEAPLAYRPGKTSVALVLDESLSMLRSDPKRRRLAAAQAFVEMAASGGRISRIGAIAFNHAARVIAPLAEMTSETPRLIASLLRQVRSEGQTNMDLALETAAEMLAAAEHGAVVFLTDGRNEPRAYQGAHRRLAERRIPIFAIGLSERADHALLERMAAETGGAAFRAAADEDLLALYQRIAAEIGCRVTLLAENVSAASLQRSVPVDRSVRQLAFALAAPGAKGRFGLRRPDGMAGDEMSGLPDVVFQCEGESRLAKIARPAAGEWQIVFDGDRAST